MTDRELLEMAAKAAGYEVEWVRNSGCHYRCEAEESREQWCPLDDDGDALRLAVHSLLNEKGFAGAGNSKLQACGVFVGVVINDTFAGRRFCQCFKLWLGKAEMRFHIMPSFSGATLVLRFRLNFSVFGVAPLRL